MFCSCRGKRGSIVTSPQRKEAKQKKPSSRCSTQRGVVMCNIHLAINRTLSSSRGKPCQPKDMPVNKRALTLRVCLKERKNVPSLRMQSEFFCRKAQATTRLAPILICVPPQPPPPSIPPIHPFHAWFGVCCGGLGCGCGGGGVVCVWCGVSCPTLFQILSATRVGVMH